MPPKFPVLCHEHFSMEGYFKTVTSLAELEKVLADEMVEITLWQNGRRLAHFLGKISEIMSPSLPKFMCFHDVNVQILMKPTQAFPGIVAPKVELTTNTEINEKSMCSSTDATQRTIHSKIEQTKARRHNCCSESEISFSGLQKRKQRPVCHTKRSDHSWQQSSSNESITSDSTAKYSSSNSSFESSSIFKLSQSTGTIHSKCEHRGRVPSAPNEHIKKCTICQSYKKTFV